MKSNAMATTAWRPKACTITRSNGAPSAPAQIWRASVASTRISGTAEHLINPRALVPESIMPGYPWLAETKLDVRDTREKLKTLKRVGVPYTDDMLEKAEQDLVAQVSPDSRSAAEFLRRYPKARVAKFDNKPGTQPSELDALVAYLQMLGTLVDFATFDASGPNLR